MSYSESESESDFNFAIKSSWNFASVFSDSKSEFDDSESDFSSVFSSILTFVFFSSYIYTLVNKLADDFFYQFS